jgi:hypothetical protein
MHLKTSDAEAYSVRLRHMFKDALAALVAGDVEECLRAVPDSSDTAEKEGILVEIGREGLSDELVARCDDLSSDETISLECRCFLLRAICALETRDEEVFFRWIADAAERACLLSFSKPDRTEAMLEAALALNQSDAFTCLRLAVSYARSSVAEERWDRAAHWLDRIGDDAGIFQSSVDWLRRAVSARSKDIE